MKVELQSYLKKKFPQLYPVDFSFECGTGWFRIILWLSRYLEMYVIQQNECAQKHPQQYQPVKPIIARQVKQKFGTLRFYYEGGDEHTTSIISFVEFISGYICESTGDLEDVGYNHKGVIQTTHTSLKRDITDFNFVDDEELRNIIKKLKYEQNYQKTNDQ